MWAQSRYESGWASGEIPSHRAGYLILIARQAGDFTLARELAMRMHRRQEMEPRWLLEMARVGAAEGNWIETVQYASKVLELSPDNEKAKQLRDRARQEALAFTKSWQ